jgi:hypothetical protein
MQRVDLDRAQELAIFRQRILTLSVSAMRTQRVEPGILADGRVVSQ